MLNKFVKIGLMTTTFGSLVATSAFTISCAEDDSIAIAIRPEDVGIWRPVAKEFEEATGTPVKFLFATDMANNYSLWASSNNMAHISIADSGIANIGYDKGWFQSFDMKDLVENPDYMIEVDNPDYKESPKLYNEETFEWEPMTSVTITDGDDTGESKSLPIIYGPQITYSWKTAPNDGNIKLFAESTTSENVVPIRWYAPAGKSNKVEEVTEYFKPDEISNKTEKTVEYSRIKGTSIVDADLNPLVKVNPDGTPKLILDTVKDFNKIPTVLINEKNYELYTNTESDAQLFINDAARISQMDVNVEKSTLENKSLDKLSKIERVIATGPTGQFQRLASLFQTIQQLTVNEDKKMILENSDAVVSGIGLDFNQVAQGNAVIWEGNDNKTNLNQSAMLEDKKWLNNDTCDISTCDKYKWNVRSSVKTTLENMSLVEKLLYYEMGYFHKGSVVSSYMVKSKNDTIRFQDGQVLALNGGKSQLNDIQAALEADEKTFEEYLTVFSTPFQTSAIDGYAISKDTPPDKLLDTKKFLRLMIEPKISAQIAGNKTLPVVKEAVQYLPDSGAEILDKKALNAGKLDNKEISPSDQINTNYILAKQSTQNLFDLYNNTWLSGVYANNGTTLVNNGISLNNYIQQIDARNADYENL